MSAFEGEADITIASCLLLRSLLGVKQTWPTAVHMSAFDQSGHQILQISKA
jgi:hypothetical protein